MSCIFLSRAGAEYCINYACRQTDQWATNLGTLISLAYTIFAYILYSIEVFPGLVWSNTTSLDLINVAIYNTKKQKSLHTI